MREKPILFSAPMIRAILAGTKTQTRRVVKTERRGWDAHALDLVCVQVHDSDQLGVQAYFGPEHFGVRCPFGQPGDRLWVRETWMPDAPRNGEWADVQFFGCGMSPLSLIPECYRKPWHCLHRATYEGCDLVGWKPSIHMPRWASRITLEVTGVRVERLQDISEADTVAEGIPAGEVSPPDAGRFAYRLLWDDISGPGSWPANPWVWVITFRRITP